MNKSPLTKKQIVNLFKKQKVVILNSEKVRIPDRPGEPKSTHADISKISSEIGWSPKVSFEEGVNKMLNEIDNWDDYQSANIRAERDYLLKESDLAINNDSPLSSADQASITTWRQELRDLPTSKSDVADIEVPACPVSGVVNT